jgi:hypothetical protein
LGVLKGGSLNGLGAQSKAGRRDGLETSRKKALSAKKKKKKKKRVRRRRKKEAGRD